MVTRAWQMQERYVTAQPQKTQHRNQATGWHFKCMY